MVNRVQTMDPTTVAVAAHDDGAIVAVEPPVDLGDGYARFHGDVTFEVWDAIGRQLQRVERNHQWWLGDWLIFGEQVFGEMYAQGIVDTTFSVQSLMDMKWVAGRIPVGARRPELTWTHHRLVAALDPEDQEYWLSRAIDEQWSTRDLKAALRATLAEPIDDAEGDREDDDDIAAGESAVDAVYRERNLAVMLAARLADRAGFAVGFKDDEDDPAYSIVYIELETGQVSWHIPNGEVIGQWQAWGRGWDGHDTALKEARVARFIVKP